MDFLSARMKKSGRCRGVAVSGDSTVLLNVGSRLLINRLLKMCIKSINYLPLFLLKEIS